MSSFDEYMATLDYYNIWFDIFDLLNFKSKIGLLSICSCMRESLTITDLYNIESTYLCKLNDDILSNTIFRNVKSLDIKPYIVIKNIQFMKNLKRLRIGGNSYIDENSIRGLDLTDINIPYDTRFHDVSNMKTLKVLKNYHATQNMIQYLDLISLNINCNRTITDVSFMKNLKILYAGSSLALTQAGIANLDLYILDVGWDSCITDVSFMRNLKKLDASGNCGINQDGIHGLDLVNLNVRHNEKIHDVSFMRNLKKLNAQGACGIGMDGIRGLELDVLKANGNPNITIPDIKKKYFYDSLTELKVKSSIR